MLQVIAWCARGGRLVLDRLRVTVAAALVAAGAAGAVVGVVGSACRRALLSVNLVGWILFWTSTIRGRTA